MIIFYRFFIHLYRRYQRHILAQNAQHAPNVVHSQNQLAVARRRGGEKGREGQERGQKGGKRRRKGRKKKKEAVHPYKLSKLGAYQRFIKYRVHKLLVYVHARTQARTNSQET